MVQMLVLAAPLVMGASLLSAVSYSDGTLIAARSAAQAIGWLLVFSTLAALWLRALQRRRIRELRHASFAEVMACATAFFCGASILYVSYFEWSEFRSAPIRTAAAQAPAYSAPDFKMIHGLPPLAILASAQVVSQPVARHERSLVKVLPVKDVVAQVSRLRAKEDPCSAFAGVEALQCSRCANESGLSLLLCHERTRLEYCEAGQGAEPSCPSAIPYSPPQ